VKVRHLFKKQKQISTEDGIIHMIDRGSIKKVVSLPNIWWCWMNPQQWPVCKEKKRWAVKTSYAWNRAELERARRGDILLMHLNEKVAEVGICKVASEKMFDEYTPIWPDELVVGKALYPHRVEIDVVYELPLPLDTKEWFDPKPSPKIKACSNANDLRGFTGKTMVPLTEEEFKYICDMISSKDREFNFQQILEQEPSPPSTMISTPYQEADATAVQPFREGVPSEAEELEEVVGPINTDLECMVREPVNELGVVGLFFYWHNELGFPEIELVRREFPDARVTERTPAGNLTSKYIEFEFKSSGYKEHTTNPKHQRRKCHYVVCWEHDWSNCPISVIELKSKIPEIQRART